MSVNENQKIFDRIYRLKYEDKEYYFEEIIKDAILKELTKDMGTAEAIAASRLNRLWNQYKREHEKDINNGIVPLFSITNEYDKKVRWIGNTLISKVQRQNYKIRPDLYKYLDSLNDREYELLLCVICELLGADKIYLTPKGNEGGIDFIARIPFSINSHFLFGIKGPIRIIGQCKQYSSKDNVGHMKEFITTMNNVYNRSYRVGEILPDWFKIENGDIIGWHISNCGHQSGALDFAKNYGILVSDSKQLIEIICTAKKIRRQSNPIKYLKSRMVEDNYTYKN